MNLIRTMCQISEVDDRSKIAHYFLAPIWSPLFLKLHKTKGTNAKLRKQAHKHEWRIGFRIGRMEAEENDLVLDLMPLSMGETLKFMGLACSEHHVVVTYSSCRGH